MYNLDTALFYLINKNFTNNFFDIFFPLITNVKHWYPLILLFSFFLIIKYKKKGLVIFVLLIITITISDQLSSHFLKNIIGRIRPCNALEHVRLLIGKRRTFSFPSSHAVNSVAISYIIIYFFNNTKYILIPIVFLVGYSRIYLGLHYPTDIIAGWIIGILIGYIIIAIYEKITNKNISYLYNNKNNVK